MHGPHVAAVGETRPERLLGEMHAAHGGPGEDVHLVEEATQPGQRRLGLVPLHGLQGGVEVRARRLQSGPHLVQVHGDGTAGALGVPHHVLRPRRSHRLLTARRGAPEFKVVLFELLHEGPILGAGRAGAVEPVAGVQGPLSLLQRALGEDGPVVLGHHVALGQRPGRCHDDVLASEVPGHGRVAVVVEQGDGRVDRDADVHDPRGPELASRALLLDFGGGPRQDDGLVHFVRVELQDLQESQEDRTNEKLVRIQFTFQRGSFGEEAAVL